MPAKSMAQIGFAVEELERLRTGKPLRGRLTKVELEDIANTKEDGLPLRKRQKRKV